ncbi:MAG: enolase C-terminal domain-like protein [Desulfobacterales bacterium]|nr:enolase C-terminal domain-like protein [Desulfobacterales bacterium]
MRIDKVIIHRVTLPFLSDFSHSLRKRSYVNNIIVEIVTEKDGIIGYGEGAPRSYVTGESQESAAKSIYGFTHRDNFPTELKDISQVWDFVDSLSGKKVYNAAICALETALLDAFGKSEDKNITEYFPKDFYTDNVYYGGAIPLAGKQRIMELCRLIKTMKINKLRMKLGKNFEQNREMLDTVHTVFGGNHDLRVDINCAWDSKLAFKHLPLIKNYKIKVVEQPMVPNEPDLANFAALMQAEGVILMADESACSLGDMEKIAKEGYYKMINVRLSKCGGFRNSLKIIDYLRTNGILFQIGCQLGESGILSAAGRALCLLCGDAVYYDGSYDEFMLKENTTFENVSFGPGGKAGPLKNPGLGVKVSPQHLKNICNDSETILLSNLKSL